MAPKSGQQEPHFNSSGDIFYIGNPIDPKQNGSEPVNNSEILPNGNDDYVFDGAFRFEEYFNADDDMFPDTCFDSPSTLVPLSNLRNVGRYIEDASFESCSSELQRLDLGLGPSICPLLEAQRAAPQRRGIGAFQRGVPRGTLRGHNKSEFLRDAVPTPRGLVSGASRPPQIGTTGGDSKGPFQGNAIPEPQGGDSGVFPAYILLESERGHVLTPSQTLPQRIPPRLLSPFVSPQSKHRQPSWQANNHLESMCRVVTSPSLTMPSTLDSQTIFSDNVYSRGGTIPAGFDQHLQNPRAHTMTPKISLASVYDNMPDNVKWSEEALQFFAQHKTGWEMTPEERNEASAFYNYNNSEPVGSSRMLKRKRSKNGNSTMRPAKILKAEVQEDTFQEENARRNDYSSRTSGPLHSTNLAPLNAPYVSNAHIVDVGQQYLQIGTESVEFAPRTDQYPPLNNASPADQRLMRDMQPRLTLQGHLQTRQGMAEEDSNMAESRYRNHEL